jgi:hypothetical protein
VRRDSLPATSREEVLADAAQFGMIGLIGQGPPVPAAPFGDDAAHGADPLAASGVMWARLEGEANGLGGLGLTGIGEGGGGIGAGIGLGRVGTLGHGDGPPGRGLGGDGSQAPRSPHWGTGRLGGSYHCRTTCRLGFASVSGRLAPEAIRRIVRQNFGRFRGCYERGLVKNPALAGTVKTRFVIGRDGAVQSTADGGSSMPDPQVAACVVNAFSAISFPQPEGGIVTVSYPIVFTNE